MKCYYVNNWVIKFSLPPYSCWSGPLESHWWPVRIVYREDSYRIWCFRKWESISGMFICCYVWIWCAHVNTICGAQTGESSVVIDVGKKVNCLVFIQVHTVCMCVHSSVPFCRSTVRVTNYDSTCLAGQCACRGEWAPSCRSVLNDIWWLPCKAGRTHQQVRAILHNDACLSISLGFTLLHFYMYLGTCTRDNVVVQGERSSVVAWNWPLVFSLIWWHCQSMEDTRSAGKSLVW